MHGGGADDASQNRIPRKEDVIGSEEDKTGSERNKIGSEKGKHRVCEKDMLGTERKT